MTISSRIATDLRVSDFELEMIDSARKYTKQSRNHFVSKAAIERAKKVLQEKKLNEVEL